MDQRSPMEQSGRRQASMAKHGHSLMTIEGWRPVGDR